MNDYKPSHRATGVIRALEYLDEELAQAWQSNRAEREERLAAQQELIAARAALTSALAERNAAQAESAGRLKVLEEKAEEARREWGRAEAAEALLVRIARWRDTLPETLADDLRPYVEIGCSTPGVVMP